ncbi:MAG: hypothetical protein GY898_07450 [Proteobacteria bacterium]|nr:hypothetical protein [Pseudomonadota bacterium]
MAPEPPPAQPPIGVRGASRWVRIALRSIHILAFSGFVGGVAFSVDDALLAPWTGASVATGLALAASYIVTDGTRFLMELRAFALYVKIGLLIAVFEAPESARLPLLVGMVLLAGWSSHMPGAWRYWSPGKPKPWA